jgi:hypothetical protein
MRYNHLFTLVALASLTLQTQAKWSKLPSVEERPVSIASILTGTTVHGSKGIDPANALLLTDPVKPVNLNAGQSEAILKFAKQSVIKSVSFVNDGTEGRVALSTSVDGSAWKAVDSQTFTQVDRLIKVSGGAAQGRFLKLQFDLVSGGVIRSFQAIGTATESNIKVSQSEDGSGVPVNFAAGVGGGRLLYISPELFGSRNEAVKSNILQFPESDDKYRTAVYDLGQIRSLNEFGSVHSPRPVRFSVYAFDSLPEKEDWRGRLAFDPTVFDTSEPVAKAEDSSGAGFLKVKPKKTVKSRYIALRWEPDFNPPAFNVFSSSISGNANTTFTQGDTTVTNTTDANGNIVTTTNSGGETSTETTSPGGEGTQGDSAEGGSPPIFNGGYIGAPSSSGAGLPGPAPAPAGPREPLPPSQDDVN